MCRARHETNLIRRARTSTHLGIATCRNSTLPVEVGMGRGKCPSLPVSKCDGTLKIKGVCSGGVEGSATRGDRNSGRGSLQGPSAPPREIRVCIIRSTNEAEGNVHNASHLRFRCAIRCLHGEACPQ